ncbi:hypothetical protein J6590_069411 [Homalodisca vitripennis]|nr:hypothetical protein J6590_069411 [Homalodisca vitripennis]
MDGIRATSQDASAAAVELGLARQDVTRLKVRDKVRRASRLAAKPPQSGALSVQPPEVVHLYNLAAPRLPLSTVPFVPTTKQQSKVYREGRETKKEERQPAEVTYIGNLEAASRRAARRARGRDLHMNATLPAIW